MARLPLLNLQAAMNGDGKAGRALAGEFAYRLRNGGLTTEESETLASMLDKIAANSDAEEALFLRQRGAPNKFRRDFKIWERVNELTEDGSPLDGSPRKPECASLQEAYKRVAKELNASDRKITVKTVKNIHLSVEKAYRTHKESCLD